jgi:outer membrane protein assembly factor BamB
VIAATVAGLLAAAGLEPVAPARAAFVAPPHLDALPTLRWAVPLPGPPHAGSGRSESCGPVAWGPWLFVGRSGLDGLLVIDRRDGSVAQVLPTSGPVLAAPLVADGWMWFSDKAGDTYAYKLDALDLATPAWTHRGGSAVLATPVRSGTHVVITNVDETVVALDGATGALAWRAAHKLSATRRTGLELYAAPSAWRADSSTLLVGYSDGSMGALDAEDGEVRWTASVGSGAYPDIVSSPRSLGGLAFAGGFSGPYLAVDLESHGPTWRLDVGTAHAPLILGDSLVLPGADGSLRRVEARTGATRWTWRTGDEGTLTTPVPTAQGLLVASSEGTVSLVDPDTGTTRWAWTPEVRSGGFSSPPWVDGGTIYALGNLGVLYAWSTVSAAPTDARPTAPWDARD